MKEVTIQSIKWDGKKITRPGLYSGIPIDVYHSAGICDGPSVSSTGLRKIFRESLADFWDTWPGNPDCEPPEDEDHFSVGRALHHLILGEPFFAKMWVIQPAEYEVEEKGAKTGELRKWNNGAGPCKAWQEYQKKVGRTVLTANQVKAIRGMAEELGRHPMVRGGALGGLIERSGFWRDKDTGIWVKWRPDSIPTDSGDYTDLKSTIDVRWDKLRRTIGEHGYHQQLALIRWGMRQLGYPFTSASLIFVKKTRPYSTRIVTVKDHHLDLGENANRAALDAMADCLKRKRWPGPGGDREDAEQIELTDWDAKADEDRLKYGIAL